MIFFLRIINAKNCILMIKAKLVSFLIIIALCNFSCKKYYSVESSVVINELLPVNNTVAADQDGEYDDWIEMYNTAPVSLDLSGYYLSDSKNDLSKWQIPTGTFISAKGYLIIWADTDTTQNGLHSNFKLSHLGEKVLFVNPDLSVIDKVEYGTQTLEIAYARNPDGSGSFVWQTPTFNASNNISK
jgi:hypothetical protein